MTDIRYDQIARLTAELSDDRRVTLAQLLADDPKTRALELASVLADQAGLSASLPTPDLLVVRIDRQLREVEAPSYRLKQGGRLCSCKVARLMISTGTLDHKAGCPEVV